MVNKEHPGNFHIAEVDFEVLSKKQVLVRIISLKHADTMEDVPAKSFLHDAEMPWLERMQTIISESMDLGESFPFVCGIDVKYIYVGK